METRQLSLFDFDEPKQEESQSVKQREPLNNPDYNPDLFHRIYEIKPDGTREWVNSYLAKFSPYYVMQLWYCHLHKFNFYYKPHLKKAAENIIIGKSMRTVILEEDGHTYIIIAKKGMNIMEGVGGSQYEYSPITLRQ